jgi:hypothetical protein
MLAALAFAALFAATAHAQPVELKRDIQASGPAVTLGDIFMGAGAVGARAVTPAPKVGQCVATPASFISAAAAAAGLEWKPLAGTGQINICNRSNGAMLRPQKQYAALTTAAPGVVVADAGAPIADAAIHRGDIITLVYLAPGLQLTTRAQAMNDAQVGGKVRVVNLQSNKTVDAVVTGVGAASANTGTSFR